MSSPPYSLTAGVLHGARDIRFEPRRRPALQSGMVLLRVVRAGICGSDLHYYASGRCGAFVPTGPFVLGHEAVGIVAEMADGVRELALGDRVVVNPARSCGQCRSCRAGRENLCPHTVMLGSASTSPPTDGAFSGWVAVGARQCHRLPEALDNSVAVLVEPLAVALQAVKQAGGVSGRPVLVTGGGPIGMLLAMVARAFGATLVALSDPVAERRAFAGRVGVDLALDPADRAIAATVRARAEDGFEVVFEASGAPAALRQAFTLVRSGGTIVQVGTLGAEDIPLPANQIMAREIRLVGSFRYGNVFEEAIRLLAGDRLDLHPLVGEVWPLAKLGAAMESALARNGGIKVQVEMEGDLA